MILADGSYILMGRLNSFGRVSVTFPLNPDRNGEYAYDDNGHVIIDGERVPYGWSN